MVVVVLSLLLLLLLLLWVLGLLVVVVVVFCMESILTFDAAITTILSNNVVLFLANSKQACKQ